MIFEDSNGTILLTRQHRKSLYSLSKMYSSHDLLVISKLYITYSKNKWPKT
jgi:hypothetical protein